MPGTLKRACSVLAFLLLLAALLLLCDRVFIRKTLSPPWDTTRKISGFYNEPEDEFSVMFFGSSHGYASFSPPELWHETGIKSYVFATQQQPMWATYYYIREALKTQSPELIVVEVNTITEEKTYASFDVVHSYLDDLPPSLNKLRLIADSAEGEDRLEYLFPLVRYHDRWDELTAADLTLDRSALRDARRGYVLLPATGFQPEPPCAGSPGAELPEKSLAWLMRICELCAEQGIDLWLVKAPSNARQAEADMFLALADRLADTDVPFDDFTLRGGELGIDVTTDYYDQRHLNAAGAMKFTDAFAALLTERYPGLTRAPDDAAWQADYEQYVKDVSAAMG